MLLLLICSRGGLSGCQLLPVGGGLLKARTEQLCVTLAKGTGYWSVEVELLAAGDPVWT